MGLLSWLFGGGKSGVRRVKRETTSFMSAFGQYTTIRTEIWKAESLPQAIDFLKGIKCKLYQRILVQTPAGTIGKGIGNGSPDYIYKANADNDGVGQPIA